MMRCHAGYIILMVFAVSLFSSINKLRAADTKTPLKKIIDSHCVKCHGPEKQKGKLRFDKLPNNIASHKDYELWFDVLQEIETRNMPPEDKKPLSASQFQYSITQIKKNLSAAAAKGVVKKAPAPLRRLTTTQYINTMKDLMSLRYSNRLYSTSLSETANSKFDNNGQSLIMTDVLLKTYMATGLKALDMVTDFSPKPTPKVVRRGNFKNRFDYFATSGNTFYTAPIDATYKISITFKTVKKHKLDPRLTSFYKKVGYNPNEDFKIKLSLHGGDKLNPDLGTYTVSKTTSTGKQEQTFTKTVKMIKGSSVRYTLVNGPKIGHFRANFYPLRDRIPELKAKFTKKKVKGNQMGFWYKMLTALDIPGLKVTDFAVAGPFIEEWPPREHVQVYGASKLTQPESIRQFAQKAFRRPVHKSEVKHYVDFLKHNPSKIKEVFSTLVSSPKFLYIYENEGMLNDYAMASRLSYFLWNTMPDRELFVLTRNKKLSNNPKEIEKQFLRLIASPKSDFIQKFVYQWLDLKNIKEMPPQNKKFRHYYKSGLGNSMQAETVAFFRYVFENNLSVRNFIDSDFTFVNESLAKVYGIKGVSGKELRKVKLASNSKRGGLLGQGAVLTASANGIETSPVLRGIWVLDNLLGSRPPDPPEVAALDPDIRGATTVRETLAKHKENSSCNACHKKIDPYGFALESFDPIGQWRTVYPDKAKIDPSGITYDGSKFRDIQDLKKILLKKEKLVARNLLALVLEYAIGRKMTIGDAPELDKLVEKLEKKGNGLKELMKLVVTSKVFLNK